SLLVEGAFGVPSAKNSREYRGHGHGHLGQFPLQSQACRIIAQKSPEGPEAQHCFDFQLLELSSSKVQDVLTRSTVLNFYYRETD
ncbi:hypothetical protein ACFL5O_11545, partial [Myxococcota bacterium]